MITQCDLKLRFHILVTRDNKYVAYTQRRIFYVWNLPNSIEKYRVIYS